MGGGRERGRERGGGGRKGGREGTGGGGEGENRGFRPVLLCLWLRLRLHLVGGTHV